MTTYQVFGRGFSACSDHAYSAGSAEHDAWSRFFAPWAGISEDPVTGSLHACIGPYWDKKLHGAAADGAAGQPAKELRFR